MTNGDPIYDFQRSNLWLSTVRLMRCAVLCLPWHTIAQMTMMNGQCVCHSLRESESTQKRVLKSPFQFSAPFAHLDTILQSSRSIFQHPFHFQSFIKIHSISFTITNVGKGKGKKIMGRIQHIYNGPLSKEALKTCWS